MIPTRVFAIPAVTDAVMVQADDKQYFRVPLKRGGWRLRQAAEASSDLIEMDIPKARIDVLTLLTRGVAGYSTGSLYPQQMRLTMRADQASTLETLAGKHSLSKQEAVRAAIDLWIAAVS